MNLMGKIFTLLILFMSITFLVVALMVGASHRNWKAMAARMKEEATQATDRLQDSKNSTTEMEKQLARERASRAMQLAQLESQLKRAKLDLISKETQLFSASEISQSRLDELEVANNRLKQQDIEVADLKANNTKLVDDIAAQFDLVKNLTNQMFEIKNQITLLESKEKSLTASLAKASRVLAANGLRPESLTDGIVPKRESYVVRVGDDGLFAVALGEDDGIRVGHVMDIYRNDSSGGRYVGKGTVVSTQHDLSAVRINKDFMTAQVQEGDSVTTKF